MKFLLLLLVLATVGCAAHRPVKTVTGIDHIIDKECLLAPVVMHNCDSYDHPHKCQTIDVKYKEGCDRVNVASVK
jgi:hypothetical protein